MDLSSISRDIFQGQLQDLDPSRLVSQKNVKCSKFAKRLDIPPSYSQNSSKQQLVLDHVKDYERQFKLLYKQHSHRHLFLYPQNECDVQKFICTTMRTTQLPFLQLYQWKQCSEFIANFLQYEQLNPPNQYPQTIPSPANVLLWQYGDSFDFAIVLCSILIGAGFDAYVVHGRAPKQITTRDLTRTKCPLQEKEGQMPDTHDLPAQDQENQFEIPVKPPIISEFIRDKEKAEIEATRIKREIEITIDDDTPQIQQPDHWKGRRLHCWVLILEGKRGIQESFFIEPTTGRTFPIAESLYENVQVVWNDKNFWIHMFPNKSIQEINFQFSSTEDWEFVMLETQTESKGKKPKYDDEGIAQDENFGPQEMGTDGYIKQIDHVLDLPPPWSPKLFIDRQIYAQKCPMGEKTVFYERCKVDYYADYSQFDGLVLRLTYYYDFKRHIVRQIRWIYSKRTDKLVMRRRFPLEYKTVEDYAPGYQHNWKQIVQIDGVSKLIIYYHTRTTDGLIRRQELFESKTREYFQDRDDYMIYRSWSIEKRDSTARDYTIGDNRTVITKMTQKFDKNPNVPKNHRIEKVVYDMKKKKLTVSYHYQPGSIRREVTQYNRDQFISLGKVPDGQEREEVDQGQQQKLQQLYDMEKECYSKIKSQENVLKQEIQEHRKQEEEWNKIKKEKGDHAKIALSKKYINKTIYDQAREKSKEQDKEREEEKVSESTAIDYLTPVLREMSLENRQLNAQEAQEVENNVMSLLKERLMHRADIIKKSLERERKALQDKINQFAKKGDHVTAQEQKRHDEELNEMNFKIEILEQRVARHEEQALQKYAEMSMKLKNEPILAAHHSNIRRD